MQQSPTAPTEQYPIVRTVIVLPVETLVSSDDQTNLNEAQKLARGAETMNRLLADYFAEMDSVKVITAEQKKVLVSNYKASRSAQAREIGQQLKSDAILLTTINRYIERQGNEYSVHQPASVAFDFKLMATESGRTICSGFFDESQKSLFENLFSFSGAMRRKFKWITASDLAAEGIRKRFDACPQLHQP
ncbi:MAG: hypothetical protein OEL66_08855 [Desulfobulbaceae bacterium]|nr:hypothetical protein [Desulfobulbaceae bacterium]